MVNSTFNICQLNKLTFTKIAWFNVQLTFVQLTLVQFTCVLEWGQAPKPPGFVALARHYAVRQAEPSDKQFVWGMKLLLSWLLLNKKLLNWPTVQLCYWFTCHWVNFFWWIDQMVKNIWWISHVETSFAGWTSHPIGLEATTTLEGLSFRHIWWRHRKVCSMKL